MSQSVRFNIHEDDEDRYEISMSVFHTTFFNTVNLRSRAHYISPLEGPLSLRAYMGTSHPRAVHNPSYRSPLESLLTATTMMVPLLDLFDIGNSSIERAIINSERDQDLQRRENINVFVTEQQFGTTSKKFDQCVICSDSYKDSEIVSVLDCAHIFHPKCIKEWCHYNPTCPLCKQHIPIET